MLAATLLVPPTSPGILHLATKARSRLSSCQYSKRVTYWRDSIRALPKPNQSVSVKQRRTVTNQRGPRMADPIFEQFPMRIVTIPVHRDVPKSVRNNSLEIQKSRIHSPHRLRGNRKLHELRLRQIPPSPHPMPTNYSKAVQCGRNP